MRETQNIMTLALMKLTKMLLGADEVLERMGETPYGMRRATKKEQLQMALNMTPEDMWEHIQTRGAPAVNRWLRSMEKEMQNG